MFEFVSGDRCWPFHFISSVLGSMISVVGTVLKRQAP